jgi:hypothetical protein
MIYIRAQGTVGVGVPKELAFFFEIFAVGRTLAKLWSGAPELMESADVATDASPRICDAHFPRIMHP